MRSSWKNPESYDVVVCSGCAAHASAFPETREGSAAATMPKVLGYELDAIAVEQTLQGLREGMQTLCKCDPVGVLRSADATYKERLSAALAERTIAGGDELLRTVIRKYDDKVRLQLASLDYPGTVSSLVTVDEWTVAVGNVLEDLLEEDSGAVAASYLYSELRSLMGEKIRLMQLSQSTGTQQATTPRSPSAGP